MMIHLVLRVWALVEKIMVAGGKVRKGRFAIIAAKERLSGGASQPWFSFHPQSLRLNTFLEI